MIDYLLQFIVGGILYTSLYHFAKRKQEWLMAILIAFPMRILFSYIYTTFTKAKLQKILSNACVTIFVTFIFVCCASILNNYLKSQMAMLISFIIWLIGMFIATKFIL